MRDQFGLVRARAIQFAAVNRSEVRFEAEVVDDTLREHTRFRGGNVERRVHNVELGESGMNAGVNDVVENPSFGEPLPIERNGKVNLL